jgi:hypothetical protein
VTVVWAGNFAREKIVEWRLEMNRQIAYWIIRDSAAREVMVATFHIWEAVEEYLKHFPTCQAYPVWLNGEEE